MSNVYYDPEAFGLTLVKDIEWRDEPYDFCMTALWRDASGRFYAASDSGCSCPSPFEDYRSLDELTPVNSLGDLLAVIRDAEENYYIGDRDSTANDRAALVSAYQSAREPA